MRNNFVIRFTMSMPQISLSSQQWPIFALTSCVFNFAMIYAESLQSVQPLHPSIEIPVRNSTLDASLKNLCCYCFACIVFFIAKHYV